MIKLDDITKVYDDSTTAVDGISFEVAEGETFGLIGTSGCGKTTTLKMINRLIEPTGGGIFVDGISVTDQPVEQLRRNIGYVIQSVGLFPHYSIEENVSVVPKLLGWGKGRTDQRTDELLRLVGLDPQQFSGRMPDALSGGQQQRVGLARALAADPALLLMDEPFGALDPITKERIRKEFKKLFRELNKTIILVTHDVFEAFDLCDRICLMDRGKAQQTGTPKELLFRPENKFVRSFLDTHRFQLEMMSVTIADIINESGVGIKASPTSPKESGQAKGDDTSNRSWTDQGDVNVLKVSFEASFFSVFEQSSAVNTHYLIVDDAGNEITRVSSDQLLRGFQEVRNILKEGRHD